MKITALVDTKLKIKPLDTAQLLSTEYLTIKAGQQYECSAISISDNGHYKVSLVPALPSLFSKALTDSVAPAVGTSTLQSDWYVFAEHWSGLYAVTQDQANEFFQISISSDLLSDLNYCLQVYHIAPLQRLKHFISQIAHESGGLQWLTEIASGSEYENRSDLGNISPGDGPKYKGAGVIQLTGRANYQDFANAMHDQDIMQGCDYVASKYPFTSAGFWWDNNAMNALCDSGATVAQVTYRVNGGYNGLSDRQAWYDLATKIFQ